MIFGRPTPTPHPRRKHAYALVVKGGVPHWVCGCGHRRNDEAVKRGRTALRAGKDAERAIAKAYGGKRTGQYGGPDDVVVGDLFVVQSKVGWFSERYFNELQKLPRAGGRIPTLIVSERGTSGKPTRRLVIRLFSDDVALHQETREL